MANHATSAAPRPRTTQQVVSLCGLLAGPALALLVYLLVPGTVGTGQAAIDLGQPGRVTAAVATLMATWWLTEAIALSATALLPLALFPMLGATSIDQAAAPYANPVIFLFLGGFMLGLAMERWGLHRRIALLTIMAVGTGPRAIVAGFMIATAVLSAFVSNTATVIMLVPIATSVLGSLGEDAPAAWRDRFAACLMLAIAYAASIGGIATLIGTPPNAVLAGLVEARTGQPIQFARWMGFVLPLVVVMLPITFLLLTGPLFRIGAGAPGAGRAVVRRQFHQLGAMRPGEWVVMSVFFATAGLWMFQDQLLRIPILARTGIDLHDAQIAMLAAVALFVIPVDRSMRTFALDWDTAKKAPYGILLLFGGGLSLAAAIEATGLDRVIGQQFALLQGMPPWVLVIAVCLLIILLTELTSNTAVTTAMLPVLAAAAPAVGVEPALLMLPATISASCAFMLPVATPPNAVAFATGRVSIAQMARAGLVLNLTMPVLITAWVFLGGRHAFTLPPEAEAVPAAEGAQPPGSPASASQPQAATDAP